MIEAKVIFSGKVQGVFFRKTVFNHAQNFSINGYVKNQLDGTVIAVFQGNKEDIEELISLIKISCGKAEVEGALVSYQTPSKSYSSFSIEY